MTRARQLLNSHRETFTNERRTLTCETELQNLAERELREARRFFRLLMRRGASVEDLSATRDWEIEARKAPALRGGR